MKAARRSGACNQLAKLLDRAFSSLGSCKMTSQPRRTSPPHGKRSVLKSVAARAFVLSALACGSCAVAVPAVTGAAGSVPGIEQHLGQGKTESFWAARYDDVVKATLRAGDKLSLKLKDKKIEEKHAHIRMTDDMNEEIALYIERRTDTVTSVHFDAGSQELSGFAHLLARQIAHELKDANAFVVDWSDDAQ